MSGPFAEDGGHPDYSGLMAEVALTLLGEPTSKRQGGREWRYGSHGSLSIDVPKVVYFNYEANQGGGVLDLIVREIGGDHRDAIEWLHADIIRNASKNWQANKSDFTQRNHDCADNRPNGKARSSDRIVVTYNYVNESRKNLFEVVRYEPKHFSQRRPDGGGGHIWNLDGVRLVLYRLPELIQAAGSGRVVFIAEANVTGFFSVLYEWSRAEVPAANDDEQAAVRGETSP
jgi:putative DNA primase/helicase